MASRRRTGRETPPADVFEERRELAGVVDANREVGEEDDVQNVRLVEQPIRVKAQLQRSATEATSDQALWVAIRTRTRAIGFDRYAEFIKRVLCDPSFLPEDSPEVEQSLRRQRFSERLLFGVDAYQLLKAATEVFLILRCGALLDTSIDQEDYQQNREEGRLGETGLTLELMRERLTQYTSNKNLPYIDRILGKLNESDFEREECEPGGEEDFGWVFCDSLIRARTYDPCLIELIWSYWHEEGMLVQAINTISLRFQNKRPSDRNPLTQLELNPLRPLSNLLWGYIQDEPFRLTVARRAYEYSHHYGLSLVGKAVPAMRPADNRSKFLEAFHSLLRQAALFYQADSDTTVIADGFPLLNSLKEVHMILAEGAHNQFGDLPWTARAEMLMQEWLLSRQEMKDFLRGRAMVPYRETWMGQADTLRRLLGWGDTPVTHFRDLGVYGEQILLSVRYGDWIDVDDQDFAKNWVRYWKPEIQGYVHAYRAVTGVDLSADEPSRQQVDTTLPSVHLQRRLAQQGAR